MLLSTFDIALRGATVALLLVLAASLFRGFGTVLAVVIPLIAPTLAVFTAASKTGM